MQREQHYALTLEMLVQVLRANNSQQIYQIATTALPEDLPVIKGKAGRGTRCQVLLCLEQGMITSCSIRTHQDRILLEGQAALEGVWACERLVWTVRTPETADTAFVGNEARRTTFSGSLPGVHLALSWAARPPPYLTRPLDASLVRSMSRQQRLVLLLVDGRRHISDVSALLHLPTDQIALTLNELEDLQLITTGSNAGGEWK